jgi:steroid delta-isomerase-like uncharacterized protein
MAATDTESRTAARVHAWNRHEPDAFAEFYAEDAEVHDPMYGEPILRRDAIRADFAAFVTAFPDARFSLGTVAVSGSTVAFEVTAHGTHNGPLAGPDGDLPATGRSMQMRIAAFSETDANGRVVVERRYYDVASLGQQLGLAAED